MGSNGKKKTTMAKLDRERRMRERRMDKQARKESCKLAALDGTADAPADDATAPDLDESVLQGVGSDRSEG